MNKKIIAVILAFAAIALLVYVSMVPTGQHPSDKEVGKAQVTIPVSVRMKWFFSGTMTGWFAGKENGFFKDAGIDLSINPGGPDNNSVKLVAAGSDLFGIAGADEVLMAREKGIPIVAVGVLFKDTPICFIAKKKRAIVTPASWTGQTIEVSYGSNAEVQYRALLKKYNVTKVKEVPYTFSLAPFIEDKVDVSVAYRMDQVVTLERQGIQLDIVNPKDSGINPYGDVIITSEKTLRDRPDLVKRFVEAAVKGFQWSIKNDQAAIGALVRGSPDLKADNEIQVWKATIPFLTANGQDPVIGLMRPDRWDETMKMLIEFGALKAGVDLSKAQVNMAAER